MASTEEEAIHDAKQGSKLYAKMLSNESNLTVPSFRVYYGVASAGSVPFLWESRPGTPKKYTSTTTLPPLTPPPSYYTAKSTHKGSSKKCKSNVIGAILPKIIPWRRRSNSFSSCVSSSSSSACGVQQCGVVAAMRSALASVIGHGSYGPKY